MEILAAHIRALQPAHAIDVVSADGHTVKPWFDGKVDFSPPVKDLGEQGFALTGGRLDQVGGRPVAVVVYRRRQHLIDLFIWPEAGPGRGPAAAFSRDGYNMRAWHQDGFSLWAASDLNASELDEFVRRWRGG
ncbi:MAG: anti-sigma factor [Rhodospirillaceae bacterium]|nr:anti-sigma factor [Rhodospirillaceae bacterium]